MIRSFRQWHLLPMMTPAAILTRVGGVYSHRGSASFFRFAGQLTEKRRPRSVCNTLGKAMVMHHPVHVQVFHADDAVGIDNASAFLMGEIVSSERDTLMHTRDGFAMLATFGSAFGELAMLALDIGKGLFFLAKEAWVLDFLPIREGGKRLESDINTDLWKKAQEVFLVHAPPRRKRTIYPCCSCKQ